MELNQDYDKVYGLTWQEKLDYLAVCRCCDRHQVNKPTVFKTWVDTPLVWNPYPPLCNCKCRHMARFICRQTEEYLDGGQPMRPSTPTSVIR